MNPRHSLFRCSSGQAFLEFALSLCLLIGPGILVVKLLATQWDHTRCLYLVFERAHAERAGRSRPSPRFGLNRSLGESSVEITVSENSDGYTGDGKCGAAHEQIELPKLETSRW